MNIDSMLRETLHSAADDAPQGAGLLGAARARSGQRRRRRRVAVAGAAVVALAATVLTAPTIMHAIAGDATSVTPSSNGKALEPPAYELPPFPFTPGRLPPGTGDTYVDFFVEGPGVPYLMSYSGSNRIPEFLVVPYTDNSEADSELVARLVHEGDDGAQRIVVTVEVDRPDTLSEPDSVPDFTTVQGREAELHNFGGAIDLTWRHRPGQWVTVTGHETTVDEVLHYAEGLVEVPFSTNPFFVFDLVPTGSKLLGMSRSQAAFGPTGASSSPGVVWVRLRPGDPAGIDNGGEPIQVGEREGVLISDERLVVFLDDGLALEVFAAGALELSREDLIRFTAGVHIVS